jgi:methanogenic corrinoid protein MtbC1
MGNSDRGMEDTGRREFSALASTVISVLSDKPATPAQTIRGAVVRKLVKATLRDGAYDAEVLLDDVLDGRVSSDQVVDIYIPEAARELGLMWLDDTITFARVTIASSRLQGLLTLLAPPWSAQFDDAADDINTLMILTAGDTHTLGPHVATAQLRRAGAAVRVLFAPSADSVLRLLEEDHYELVMFSCSRTESLATVAQVVRRMRTGLTGTPPIALGGLVLNHADKLKELTGVDIVTNDIKVAFRLCDKKRPKTRAATR